MSSVLHLGLPPKANQAVPGDLAARGITLLKAALQQLNALVTNQINQPFHDFLPWPTSQPLLRQLGLKDRSQSATDTFRSSST